MSVGNSTKRKSPRKGQIDLLGQRFGTLTVIERGPNGHRGYSQWKCRCDCGTEKIIREADLIRGTRSCGCLRRDNGRKLNFKHGLALTPIYRVWKSMRGRCLSPKHHAYQEYGGRGITISESWLTFTNFVADMGPTYQKGLQLDRIDNNGPYSKDNCRWASRSQQMNNTRRTKPVTFRGRTQTVTEWARELGLERGTIYNRIFVYGWDITRALTEPTNQRYNHSHH